MDIKEVKEILLKSWSKETCSPGLRENWSPENPSLGQCAITAMLVYYLCGGKIMRCMASTGSHYYNMIDDKIVDLTVEQFMGEVPKYEEGQERTIDYLLSNEDTKIRFLMLSKEFSYNMRLNTSLEQEKSTQDIRIKRKRRHKHLGGIK